MGPETDPAYGGGHVFRYLNSVRDGEEYEDVGGRESVAGDSGRGFNIVG